jgi:hypothetical protein
MPTNHVAAIGFAVATGTRDERTSRTRPKRFRMRQACPSSAKPARLSGATKLSPPASSRTSRSRASPSSIVFGSGFSLPEHPVTSHVRQLFPPSGAGFRRTWKLVAGLWPHVLGGRQATLRNSLSPFSQLIQPEPFMERWGHPPASTWSPTTTSARGFGLSILLLSSPKPSTGITAPPSHPVRRRRPRATPSPWPLVFPDRRATPLLARVARALACYPVSVVGNRPLLIRPAVFAYSARSPGSPFARSDHPRKE